ncbi:Uncharacterized protein APZ42_019096 [Daphnia magna]|uniref:Uncharacterized protein n=1 Tax=Daphnia magna TaxID=35525 RepID=A0A0P6BTN8_9CRUS|nr:Uncharacterized protein APZ42_019096 [Daphnia magna]
MPGLKRGYDAKRRSLLVYDELETRESILRLQLHLVYLTLFKFPATNLHQRTHALTIHFKQRALLLI